MDVKDPAKPRLISIFPLPVPPPGEPYKDFCDKGGRFGPHNTNLEYHLPGMEKPGNLIYATYFRRIGDVQEEGLWPSTTLPCSIPTKHQA